MSTITHLTTALQGNQDTFLYSGDEKIQKSGNLSGLLSIHRDRRWCYQTQWSRDNFLGGVKQFHSFTGRKKKYLMQRLMLHYSQLRFAPICRYLTSPYEFISMSTGIVYHLFSQRLLQNRMWTVQSPLRLEPRQEGWNQGARPVGIICEGTIRRLATPRNLVLLLLALPIQPHQPRLNRLNSPSKKNLTSVFRLSPSIVWVSLMFGLPDYIRPPHSTFRPRSHIDFKVDAQPSYFPENTCFCHWGLRHCFGISNRSSNTRLPLCFADIFFSWYVGSCPHICCCWK